MNVETVSHLREEICKALFSLEVHFVSAAIQKELIHCIISSFQKRKSSLA